MNRFECTCTLRKLIAMIEDGMDIELAAADLDDMVDMLQLTSDSGEHDW